MAAFTPVLFFGVSVLFMPFTIPFGMLVGATLGAPVHNWMRQRKLSTAIPLKGTDDGIEADV